MINKKLILLILDGWGQGEKNVSNPFRFAKTETLDYLKKFFPFCLLNASGYAVGFPKNQPATCGIGHLTIGTGIIFYQPAVKINLEIENGSFFENENLLTIFLHTRKYNSRLHLVGILSEKNNLADINHLIAVLQLAKQEKFDNIYLHLFTDGIDSGQKSALSLLESLLKTIEEQKLPGKIATLCGRFYALDKNNEYFLRTQRAFLLLVEGKGNIAQNPIEFLKTKYQEADFNDSTLPPTIFITDAFIKNDDAVLFFHHEAKNIFQLANSFLNPAFKEFDRPKRENLYIASLTRYFDNIDYPVIYEEQKIKNNLSRIIAEYKLKQLKIIHLNRKELLTFYFNGFFEEKHPDEEFKFLPPFESNTQSLKDKTNEFFDYLKIAAKEGAFDIIVANLPTFEFVGHSGNFRLAISTIEEVDKMLKDFIGICLENNYSVILTSDHGNIEKMVDPKSGTQDTIDNPNPVPFYLIDPDYRHEKTPAEINLLERKPLGSLVDIAPTILNLIHIPVPQEFIGKNLLIYF